MNPRYWKTLERHPLSAEYSDLPPNQLAAFVADLKAHGIQNKRKVTLHEGQVLDGWQFQRACVEANIRPDYQALPKNIPPEIYVRIVNDNRRHESVETAHRRAEERRKRVAEIAKTGKSLRQIAEEEGVSHVTIQEDLKSAVNPLPVTTTYATGETKAKRGAILCEKCKRLGAVKGCEYCEKERKAARASGRAPGDGATAAPKNGAVLFDWPKFDSCYGALLREVDRAGSPFKANNKAEAEGLRRLLAEWRKAFKDWHKQLMKAH